MGLEGRFAELERERLAKLAREWLDIERRRAPFQVAAVEQKRDVAVAGLEFKSRIDRMDELQDGGHVLIDYKSSRMLSPKQWDGPRPDDPQLPLYAVAAPEELAAVVFARMRPGEMRFMGFSDKPNAAAARSKSPRSWPALLADVEARRRRARQVVRRRRGAGRPEGRPEDLPPVRAAHALPRLRES